MKRTELVVLVLILAIAAGMRLYALDRIPPGLSQNEAINGTYAQVALETQSRGGLYIDLQALSIHFFGNTIFALRFVSALLGILTVLAVYLLCRRMFDSWELAAMAAMLMATGFWHVNFSRIGIGAVFAPLLAAWGFYYLYKGIETHRLWHWGLAGVMFGIGFHTSVAFRLMPVAIALVLVAYWWGLARTFSHGKYEYARHQMLGGVFTMLAVTMLIILPIAGQLSVNPSDFSGQHFVDNTVRTVGMLFYRGDTNWGHNIAGSPALFWPVAALAAAGLLHTIWRLVHSLRTRGQPGIVQTLLLAWLFVGLLPGILSSDAIPNALRTLTAAPAAYILAAVGLHWLHVWLRKWYTERDAHPGEGAMVTGFAILSLLVAFGIADANRYGIEWARDPRVAHAFDAHYLPIAARLNSLPPATLKYVIVSRGDDSAQSVMYLTDTGTITKQHMRHVTYLTPEQFKKTRIPAGAIVISLDP